LNDEKDQLLLENYNDLFDSKVEEIKIKLYELENSYTEFKRI